MNKLNSTFLLIYLISFQLFADDTCLPNGGEVNGIFKTMSKDMSKVVSLVSDSPLVQIEAANTYLSSIAETVNFSESDTLKFIDKVKAICVSTAIDNVTRSKACATQSGLNGKMADKLRMSGLEYARAAYNLLKLSMQLDANNKDAITGHAMMVAGVYEQSFFIRKIAEKSLGMDVNAEAKIAIANMERLNLKNLPVYKTLSDKLN